MSTKINTSIFTDSNDFYAWLDTIAVNEDIDIEELGIRVDKAAFTENISIDDYICTLISS